MATTTDSKQTQADGAARLDEWVGRTRALVEAAWPNARWASLIVNLGDGLPSTRLVVIPPAEVPGAKAGPAE